MGHHYGSEARSKNDVGMDSSTTPFQHQPHLVSFWTAPILRIGSATTFHDAETLGLLSGMNRPLCSASGSVSLTLPIPDPDNPSVTGFHAVVQSRNLCDPPLSILPFCLVNAQSLQTEPCSKNCIVDRACGLIQSFRTRDVQRLFSSSTPGVSYFAVVGTPNIVGRSNGFQMSQLRRDDDCEVANSGLELSLHPMKYAHAENPYSQVSCVGAFPPRSWILGGSRCSAQAPGTFCWDVETGKKTAQLSSRGKSVGKIVCSDEHGLVIAFDHYARAFDLRTPPPTNSVDSDYLRGAWNAGRENTFVLQDGDRSIFCGGGGFELAGKHKILCERVERQRKKQSRSIAVWDLRKPSEVLRKFCPYPNNGIGCYRRGFTKIGDRDLFVTAIQTNWGAFKKRPKRNKFALVSWSSEGDVLQTRAIENPPWPGDDEDNGSGSDWARCVIDSLHFVGDLDDAREGGDPFSSQDEVIAFLLKWILVDSAPKSCCAVRIWLVDSSRSVLVPRAMIHGF